MKILFINQTYYPDVVATAQQLTDLTVQMVKEGHDVTVLVGQRGYSEPHPKYVARENYRGVNVIRVWPLSFGRKFRIARVLDALCMNLSYLWKLLWLPKYDKVVSMTTPPLVGLPSLLIAKLKKEKFVYWMMDINPDEAIKLGWIKEGSLLARFLNKTLSFVLKRSDLIIVLDKYMKKRIVLKGARSESIRINPPWSVNDPVEPIPHEKNVFRDKYNLQNKFVVMYSGNHSVCHPLDTLLEAAKILSEDKEIVFSFVGSGQRVQDVKHFREKHNLQNIIQLPYQDKEQIPQSLSAADVHAVIMGDGFVGIVHPCKLYGILTIGRPFVYIGPKESHLGEIVFSDKIGYHVNHGDPDSLVEVIRQVKGLEIKDRELMRGRECVIGSEFSKDFLCKRLIAAISG